MKKTLGLLAASATMVGAGLVNAGPAAAAPPYWQPVDTNANWSCSPYKSHRLSFNIKFKTCIVRNANNDAQAVLVVQNSGTKAADIRGVLQTENTGGIYEGSWRATCTHSTLNPGFTRGCFNQTFSGTRDIAATSQLYMNGDEEANLSVDSWHG
ncbi:hypothetical protein ACF1G0_19100 [Streptomyces sp. NPDC013953]|uniref:hypothetical protein n=1 Tax=Streptomyces sp. NPDC013953 TaxID=3364868 RepID=UPI0036FFEA1D